MIALTLLACGGGPGHGEDRRAPQTKLLTGPVFWDGSRELRAIEVDAEGRVVALHAELPAEEGRALHRLPGMLALPGLHDAHAHVRGIGRQREQVSLLELSSIAELRERIATFLRENPEVPAVVGRGWDQSRLPGRSYPTADDLEGLTDKPILLRRVDGHAGLANRVLMAMAGIDASTADPPGGRLLRDSDGRPTGVFIDEAMAPLFDALPRSSDEDIRRQLWAGCEAAADAGLTAIHDMGMSARSFRILRTLDAERDLPLRVFVYIHSDDFGELAALTKLPPTPRTRLMGMKVLIDGAMGSRGAALLADYHDEPGNTGLLTYDPDLLAEQVAALQAMNLQVAVHAIGDRANRETLDAIQRGAGGDPRRRHRIEHAQLVHAEDFQRFGELGVIASMQPTHATSDSRWALDRVGPERLAGAYAWRTMLDHGVPLAFGSDAPVESHDPRLGIFASVGRMRVEDPEARDAFVAEQALTLHQTVDAFTRGAAYAVHLEDELSCFRPGCKLDLSIFHDDPRTGDPRAWLVARPAATLVDGSLRPARVAAGPRSPYSVEALDWLLGTWSGTTDGLTVTESWSIGAFGGHLGVNRSTRGAQQVNSEDLSLERRGTKVIYRAAPEGQEATEFLLVDSGEGVAVFENPEHDFPQRIGYRQVEDRLEVFIEGMNGEGRTAWTWTRVADATTE
jgi:predicted amidohydrolase YtcJ